MQYMVGAYSVVLLTQGKLVAFRDPNGFRPLCIGEVDGSIMFASESCAFPVLGGHLIREVEPGEVVVADLGAGTYRSVPSGIKARSSLCMFEFIYFSRADSVIDGASVDLVRLEAGRCLGTAEDRGGGLRHRRTGFRHHPGPWASLESPDCPSRPVSSRIAMLPVPLLNLERKNGKRLCVLSSTPWHLRFAASA